jgi:hypothetical protein
MRARAAELFHRLPQNLNCAQAVLAAWKEATGDPSHSVEDFRAFGGGRAPGGTCGALYAACQVKTEAKEAMQAAFLAKFGELGCRELKGKTVSCKDCVETAAEILDQS